MRIRSRLMTLVFATLLPTCLAAVIGIVHVYQNLQESNWRSLRETSRALAMLVENEISASRLALQTIAQSPAFHQANIALIHEYLKRLGQNRRIHYMVLDPTGRLVASSAEADQSSAGLWGGGFMAGPPTDNDADVSPLYFSSGLRAMAYSLRVPVMRENRLLYVLQAEIPTSEIQQLLEQQRLPARWIGTILDSNSVIVARSREAERFSGNSVTGPIRGKLRTMSEGSNIGRALSGEMVNAYFSRMPLSGWAFVVSVPQGEWREPALRASLVTGLVMILILGLGVVAAAVLARRVVRPIEALRATAIEMGQGGNPSPARSGIAEVDDVANELYHASQAIRGAELRLQEKVAQAVAETERTQRALLQSQKLEALGRLTGGIAHDFNNVLQTMTSGLHIAMNTSGDQRVRALLETCERAVQRAVELTRQLMAFGRVQDARQVTVDLQQHLEAILPLLRGAVPVHVSLEVHLQPVWPVAIDPLQLELALLNLTINARDAMPNGGRLTLKLENADLPAPPGNLAPGQYVRLELADTGQGMSQEVASRALDPFFTTKAVGAGSGLGLPQAYGFSLQSGGTLVLHSEAGQGTCVTILLPRSGLEPPTPVGPEQMSEPEQAAGTRLLFVEDDSEVRNVVEYALSTHGFSVTVATNADEALLCLKSASFELVFSDIVMPGSMNGIALAETVRREWPQTHVVLATGYSHENASIAGVRVLGKPYLVSELVEALRAEIQGSAA
jgi:signal transduction histidine kinase